ncbi:Crp/Fnr family transcriptional regulator [Aquimarina longa]|uniref:Crp/Fnr family transcriptional regulator n=1 Tax=Aquimarina longa TaxID=1080221 RepID=UPI000782A77F|nr:Crp/Fnr family transcriptional regulator [Aquimarina longa]
MKSELLEFLLSFPSLKEEEAKEIAEIITVRTFKKGTVLLKEGQIDDKCYFVLKGCIRRYSIIDGEEKTTSFFTEKQAVISITTYTKQLPSNHYLCCIEDSIVIESNYEEEQGMYQEYPKLEAITRTMMEQNYSKTQENFESFIISSPEKRYINLLKNRSELLNRVPQHQIASYLGMAPESLSRIRKRIFSKK